MNSEARSTNSSSTITLHELRAPLEDWLKTKGLPWWSTHGIDWTEGGFFERFDAHGAPIEEPRRLRVVARQIYVFATATRLNFFPDGERIVDHGLDFLFTQMQQSDGTFNAAICPAAREEHLRFKLYDHAFVLFCLAKVFALKPSKYVDLRGRALTLLDRMRRGWGHPTAGFEEASPRILPLLSNPHMHLFEAALAWLEHDTDDTGVWARLAKELCALCLQSFRDSKTGAIRELFDGSWTACSSDQSQVVEPGHQFEWAWLLVNWSKISGAAEAMSAAHRLVECGETYGVDQDRNVAINLLSPELTSLDCNAKLWPQTERLKAWCALHTAAETIAERERAKMMIAKSRDGLMQYLSSNDGRWHEVLGADGCYLPEPTRASSLYHIVCSVETLLKSLGTAESDQALLAMTIN